VIIGPRFAGSCVRKLRLKHFIPLFFSSIILCLCADPPIAAGLQSVSGSAFPAPVPNVATSKSLSDEVSRLLLFTISDGRAHCFAFTKKDLMTGPLDVPGYVTGIVVFCGQGVDVHVAGNETRLLLRDADGSFPLMYFGRLSRQRGSNPTFTADPSLNPFEGSRALRRGHPRFAGGYSIFPMIVGTPLSKKDIFAIHFETPDGTFSVDVRHQISSLTHTLAEDTAGKKQGRVRFRYWGNRTELLRKQSPDIEKRLSAIARGIDSVDRTYGEDLVDTVNIVDYEGIHNAVTTAKTNSIFFYIDAFKDEGVADLKYMAEHEALHRYVKEKHLTLDSGVRTLFADLKGFGTFSSQRFNVLTYGHSNCSFADANAADSPFFSFINEGNFLKGGKGGHSQDNLDEFCTSFLHSAMYMDRLPLNLDRPLEGCNTAASGRNNYLTQQQKNTMMNDYARTLDAMASAVSRDDRRSAESAPDPAIAFLKKRLSSSRDNAPSR
jgi:hypothetical protein